MLLTVRFTAALAAPLVGGRCLLWNSFWCALCQTPALLTFRIQHKSAHIVLFSFAAIWEGLYFKASAAELCDMY